MRFTTKVLLSTVFMLLFSVNSPGIAQDFDQELPAPETAEQSPSVADADGPEPSTEDAKAALNDEEDLSSGGQVAATATSAGASGETDVQTGGPATLTPDVVGAGGAFTQRIEIDIPKFRDLPLSVALTYNSSDTARAGADKLVAFGWELKGFSVIERKSIGGGVPTFDDGQDLYLLDGDELLACAGAQAINPWVLKYPLRFLTDSPSASCAAGGNLTSQVEDFHRITFDAASNSFIVTRPNGVRLLYTSVGTIVGDTSTAGTPAHNYATKARWLLTRVEDAQSTSNVVTYTYAFTPQADGYAPRPVRIDYAGYSVEFSYREYPANAIPKFATGTALAGRQLHQLQSIRIYEGSTPIRGYMLAHSTSTLTQTQLLTSITEFGSDFVTNGPDITGGSALPAVNFGYSEDSVSFQSISYPGFEFHERVTVSDTNYDGADDLIFEAAPLKTSSVVHYGGDGHTVYNTYYTFMKGHYSISRARSLSSLLPILKGCRKPYKTMKFIGATQYDVQPTPGRFSDAILISGNDRKLSPLVCLEYTSTVTEIGGEREVTSIDVSTFNVLSNSTNPIDTETFSAIENTSQKTKLALGYYDLDPSEEFAIGDDIFDVYNGAILPDTQGNTFGADQLLGQYSADFTGDGVFDSIQNIYNQRRLYRVRPETGYFSGALKSRTSVHWTSIPLANLPFVPAPGGSGSTYLEQLLGDDFLGYADIDSDGLTDLIFQKSNLTSADSLVVYQSTGFGTRAPITFSLPNLLAKNRSYVEGSEIKWRTLNHRTSFQDINADGLVDIILHDGFTTSQPTDVPYRSGRSWVFINKGDSFVQVPVNGSLAAFTHLVATGDFDGDGLTDIALEGQLNTSTGNTYVREDGRILFGNGEVPNRLISVQSSAGGVTTVVYAPSSDFGTNQMPGIQQVVKTITTDDGRGGVSTVDYSYFGGRYDFVARQTLGYRTVTAVLPALAGESEGPQIVTTYLNDHLAEYGLVKSRVVVQGGVTLSREIFDYAIQKTGNGPWRADRTSERRAALFDTALVETMLTRAYDGFGQVVRETTLGFTADGVNLDPSDDVTVSMGYAPNLAAYIVDRPSFRREEAGGATTATLADDLSYAAMSYDGAATNTTAPSNGNPTKVEEWTGNTAALTLRTAKLLTYDAWGNLLTETDAKAAAAGTGPTVIYTYDTAKRLFRLTTSNALGHVETVAWNTLCQAPATVTDPNLRVTTKTYDTFCRETRTDLPGGQYLITRYVAFGAPTLQHVERETKSGSTTPGRDLSISREYFDGLGRSWAKVQPGTTSAIADAIITLSAYDARGNLAWTSLPLPFANLNTTPNAALRTSFTYDGLNRSVDTILPDGAKRSLAYLTTSLSHYGGPTLAYPTTRTQDEHCFDAPTANTICGEAVQITDAAGRLIRSDRNDTALTDLDAGGQTLRSTSYRYDLKGSLIGVTDPGGITFTYTYDVFGNRLTADDPGLGFWTLTYDANNNLLTQTDAKGQLISFTYDALNRVTVKTVGIGPSRVETRFTYDEVRAGFYNMGMETTQRIWTPTATTHKVERDWHLMGGLAVERHTIDGYTYALHTSFAPNGAPLDQKLPGTPGATNSGWIGPFTYDAAGRVTAMTGYITSVTYNAWGQPTAAAYANGVAETYAYDPARGWLNSVTGTLPGGDMAFRAAYTRSATGRIARADTQALVGGNPTDLGGSYDYAYDYTGRLVAATNWRGVTAFDQAFAYDRAGRIRLKGPTLATATTYAYTDPLKPDHAPSAVTTAGVTTPFTYDANGNMLTGLAGKIMTYDGENRPLSVTFNGKRTCYVYGVDGKRLKKVEGLPPTQDCTARPANANATVYFGAVEVRNWKVAGLEQVLTYPHPAVKLLNGVTPAVATYLHRDGLASVRAITSAAGAKIEAALYKPFGEQSEWVLPGNAAPETKGWIGERYDADAGLQYLNARYYDPELSLFLQPDWFEVTKAGTNRLSYCGGDPINCSDTTGNVPDNWGTKESPVGYDSNGFRHEYQGEGKLDEVTYESRNDHNHEDYDRYNHDPDNWSHLDGEFGVLTEKHVIDGGARGGTYGHQSYGDLVKMSWREYWDPPIQSGDAIFDIIGGAAIARAAVKTTVGAARSFTSEMLLENGSLRATKTVEAQLAGTRSYIPTESILDTVRYGARTPDPKNVDGFFMYTADATRSFANAILNPRSASGYLEVLVDETNSLVAHVMFKTW